VPENPIWEKSGFVWNESFAGLSKQRVIAKIFSRMNELLRDYTFTDGILAVAGNHEHWNSTKAFLEVFKSSRFCKLLVNEWHSITRENISLDVFGADDFLTGIPHLPSARSSNGSNNSRDSAPKSCQILVSHNPDLVSYGLHRDGERFPFSLSLSGHTHGGQVRVPGIGALTYQVFDRRFGEGRVEMFGKHTYTSRGVGVVSVPFRLDCPPEVTLITLATPSS
jgi:predicted MPP superfamily phosphohydrolase